MGKNSRSLKQKIKDAKKAKQMEGVQINSIKKDKNEQALRSKIKKVKKTKDNKIKESVLTEDDKIIKFYTKKLGKKKKPKNKFDDMFDGLDCDFSDEEEIDAYCKKTYGKNNLNETNDSTEDEDLNMSCDEDIDQSEMDDEEVIDSENEMADGESEYDEEIENISDIEEVNEEYEVGEQIDNSNDDSSCLPENEDDDKLIKNTPIENEKKNKSKSLLFESNGCKIIKSNKEIKYSLCVLNNKSLINIPKCLIEIENCFQNHPEKDVKAAITFLLLDECNEHSSLNWAVIFSSLHYRLDNSTYILQFVLDEVIRQYIMSVPMEKWSETSHSEVKLVGLLNFLAYLTKMNSVDANLLLDLIEEMSKHDNDYIKTLMCSMLKIACPELKDQSRKRCLEFRLEFSHQNNMSDTLNSQICFLLSKKYNKRNWDNYEEYMKFKKELTSFYGGKKTKTSEGVYLRLADFNKDGFQWWNMTTANASTKKMLETPDNIDKKLQSDQEFVNEDAKVIKSAIALGFVTPAKIKMFCILMKMHKLFENNSDFSKHYKDLIKLCTKKASGLYLTGQDALTLIMSCLIFDENPSDFYAHVVQGLVACNSHIFLQATRCTIWDMMKLLRNTSEQHILGNFTGLLLTRRVVACKILNKYVFSSADEANNEFMRQIIRQIVKCSWYEIEALLDDMINHISKKFGKNLRTFVRINFIKNKDEQSYLNNNDNRSKITKAIEYLSKLIAI